jgi:hypothetical protein
LAVVRTVAERARGSVPVWDDTPARASATVSGQASASATHRAVGLAVHSALSELAASRDDMRAQVVLRVAARHARATAAATGCRIGAQHVGPLCAVAVRMFPPSSWDLIGSEHPAGDGTADLVWRSPGREVVIDEVKVSGLARVLVDSRTRAQIDRFRRWGVGEFGDLFAGVRLLALAGPLRSRWFPPVGSSTRLADTEWWWFEQGQP